MKKELELEFAKVTEAAAVAAYDYIGQGNKEDADQVAVDTMRSSLNTMKIAGEIVIGEGEIDEAPMLYIGEALGRGGTPVDIAVDPIEGTRMVAKGQDNAIAVLAAANKGSFLKAPDMYMEKLIVGAKAKGIIDLNKPLLENIENISKALNKPYEEIRIFILDKPRHQDIIQSLQKKGLRVFAVSDGDVVGAILSAVDASEVDILYGIGGAPEGVIAAAAIKALGGDMHGRLVLRSDIKGSTPENDSITTSELKRCQEMGVTPNVVLELDDLVKDDEVIFTASGITSGPLLKGVSLTQFGLTVQTLLVRGKTKTIRFMDTTYNLDYKSNLITGKTK